MTPKEKCDQLIEKYKPIVTLKMGFEQSYILVKAKQCALIAIDELIKLYEFENPHRGFKISYWDEVKTEIEKL